MWSVQIFNSQTANLKNHMKVHSGGKSNKCDHCKSQHLKTVNLNTPMKVHTGGKSNKCDQCNFANAQAAILRIHIREHSGEKPNICDQCNYSSTQANTIYMLSWQILDTDKACIDETEMLWREKWNWCWTRADIACQCGKWTNTRINGVGKIYVHTGHCWYRYFEMNESQNCLLLVGSYQWWLNSIQMALAFGSCL